MKYYSEKLDKLFDTKEALVKAEEEVSPKPSATVNEELEANAVKINKLAQVYDSLQKEFAEQLESIVNDPVIPTFIDQFRKYVETVGEDEGSISPEVVNAFVFLYSLMEDMEDDDCCGNCLESSCKDCDEYYDDDVKETVDDDGYHAEGETKNGTKWSVEVKKDTGVCSESFGDVLNKFFHSLLS